MPVVKLARDGFEVTKDMIRVLKREETLIKTNYSDPSGHLIENYFNKKKIIQPGEKIKRLNFANVLEQIALQGPNGFYSGPIADNIVKAITDNGGIISHDDLKNYKVKTYKPITSEFMGNILHMPSFPSGSPATVLILNILETYGLKKENKTDPLFYHRFIEATKFARSAWLNSSGDSMENTEELKSLLNHVFLK